MSEMIERVAKAIDPMPWSELAVSSWTPTALRAARKNAIAMAHSAMEAMASEPESEVERAAKAVFDVRSSVYDFVFTWEQTDSHRKDLYRSEAKAALDAAWEPIDTSPVDKIVLVYMPWIKLVRQARLNYRCGGKRGWQVAFSPSQSFYLSRPPSHWRPLPVAPDVLSQAHSTTTNSQEQKP